MISANILWVSEKGYGFVKTACNKNAYVPHHIMLKVEKPIENMKVKVKLEDGDKGHRVSEIVLDEVS